MATDDSRVIVTTGATASTFTVYHRDLPEVRAEGETPAVAGTHLVNALTRSLDTALTDWRRSTLDQAIAEVRAFVAQGS